MYPVNAIEYSPEALADFCNLWDFSVESTQENPELAFHVLNGLWGIPIIPGPQAARRPAILALGRAIGAGFPSAQYHPFKMRFATIVGRMQAWPVLYEYRSKLMGMSEGELIEHFDNVKAFYDLHAGIAATIGVVGVGGMIKGKTPGEIVKSVGRRALAMGDGVGDAVLERMETETKKRFPKAASRLSTVGKAMSGSAAGAFGIIAGVVYVATIAEASDKLNEISAIATIKYRNGELSEAAIAHILDLHPTQKPPEPYYEKPL